MAFWDSKLEFARCFDCFILSLSLFLFLFLSLFLSLGVDNRRLGSSLDFRQSTHSVGVSLSGSNRQVQHVGLFVAQWRVWKLEIFFVLSGERFDHTCCSWSLRHWIRKQGIIATLLSKKKPKYKKKEF